MAAITQPGGSISSGMPTPDQFPVSGSIGAVDYQAYQAAMQAWQGRNQAPRAQSNPFAYGPLSDEAKAEAEATARQNALDLQAAQVKQATKVANTPLYSASAAPISSGVIGGSVVSGGGTQVGGGTGTSAGTNLTPWDQQRGTAATTLASTMNPSNDPSNLYRDKMASMVNGQFSPDDPSYQFRLNQGQQTLERSLGARGLLQSGNAGAELQAYGQNTASTEYGAQFARLLSGLTGVESQYNSQQQRLMSMAGVGADPTASGTLGVAQTNAATQQAQVGVNAAQVGVNQQKVSNDFTSQMAGIGQGGSSNIWANIWG